MQPLQNAKDTRQQPDKRTPLTLLPTYDDQREALVRTLALDRLRELHDDGVTMDYVGRMYGVSGAYLEDLESELREDRSPRCPAPDRLFS